MPYKVIKRKCKQSDGDAGSYVLSYKDKSGKSHNNCHTTKKLARAQISAIEMDEGWRPLAVKITKILEEELAELAGEFLQSRSQSDEQEELNV